MRIGVGLGVLVATAALAFAALNLPTGSAASSARSGGRCADKGNRWLVRTLQDRPKLLPAHAITYDKLKSLHRPIPLPATRHSTERQIVTLKALGSRVTEDASGNIGLILGFTGKKKSVYASVPLAACNARATLQRRRQMGNARRTIIELSHHGTGGYGPCRITGVVFFSTRREDNEVLNLVELSPILAVNSSNTC